MAGNFGIAQTSQAHTLPTATERTLLQLKAPSTHGLRIRRFCVAFAGTSQTGNRVSVFFRKGTTSGGTGASVTPKKSSGHSGALGATAKENFNSGGSAAEPTISDTTKLKPLQVAPTQSYEAPLDMVLAPDETLNLVVNSTDASIPATAWVEFEE